MYYARTSLRNEDIQPIKLLPLKKKKEEINLYQIKFLRVWSNFKE